MEDTEKIPVFLKIVNGKTVAYGACLSGCQVFGYKPIGILFGGDDCDYYLSENEEDESN